MPQGRLDEDMLVVDKTHVPGTIPIYHALVASNSASSGLHVR